LTGICRQLAEVLLLLLLPPPEHTAANLCSGITAVDCHLMLQLRRGQSCHAKAAAAAAAAVAAAHQQQAGMLAEQSMLSLLLLLLLLEQQSKRYPGQHLQLQLNKIG
jgi:hypothetical protein